MVLVHPVEKLVNFPSMQRNVLRGLSLWHVAIVAGIALVIDYISMHSGLHLLHFNVPENAEYFISKFVIVSLVTAIVMVKFGYKIKSALIAAIAGSSAFSLYYFVSRPSIIYESQSQLCAAIYPPPPGCVVYDLQTSITIWAVHGIAIFVGFVVVSKLMKRSRTSGV